jgi:uncharacterized protein YciI
MIMGLLRKIFSAPGRIYRWLYQDENRLRRSQAGRLKPSDGEPDADVNYDEQKRMAEDYNAWEEIDNYRANFFFGSWATKKFKAIGSGQFQRDREARARERAATEGREYKSRLQQDLEAAAKKRDEKERLKAEKRRQKEERKRKI